MIPPDLFLLLQHQRHQEMVLKEQARLVRASRRQAAFDEPVFHSLLWWVGGALLSWGYALQQAGRTTQADEKGCCICLR